MIRSSNEEKSISDNNTVISPLQSITHSGDPWARIEQWEWDCQWTRTLPTGSPNWTSGRLDCTDWSEWSPLVFDHRSSPVDAVRRDCLATWTKDHESHTRIHHLHTQHDHPRTNTCPVRHWIDTEMPSQSMHSDWLGSVVVDRRSIAVRRIFVLHWICCSHLGKRHCGCCHRSVVLVSDTMLIRSMWKHTSRKKKEKRMERELTWSDAKLSHRCPSDQSTGSISDETGEISRFSAIVPLLCAKILDKAAFQPWPIIIDGDDLRWRVSLMDQ